MTGHMGGQGPTLVGVIWMETSIATAFVAARIYTRKCIMKFLAWEDWFAIVTLIFFYLFATMTTISSWYGLGRHISTFTFPEMPAYFSAGKFEAIAVTMCVLGSATSKTTVACFLLRIVLKRRHKVVLWLCLLTLWIDVVIVVVMLWLSCRPVQRIWDPLVRGKCPIDATTLQIAGAYFLLALLPWDIVWKLNMRRKERLTVAIGLSLGVFAGICGIVRIVEVSKTDFKDYLASVVSPHLWSATEFLVTVLCSTIPVLRPLYVKIRRRGSQHDSASYHLPKFAKKSPRNITEEEEEDRDVTLLKPPSPVVQNEGRGSLYGGEEGKEDRGEEGERRWRGEFGGSAV